MRLVARRAEGSLEQNQRRLATVFYLLLGLGALALVATFGIVAWLRGADGIPAALQEQVPLLILLLGLRHGALLLPLGFFRGVLFGAQRFRFLNATQLSVSLLQGLATWWVLSAGYGLLGLACVHLGCMLVEHLLYAWLAFRVVPELDLRPRHIDRKVLPELASFSGWTLLGSVAGLILLRTDPLIVKSALPLAAVTLYGVALKVTEALLLVLKQAVNLLSPIAADLQARGDHEGLQRTLLSSTRSVTGVAFAIALPLALLAEPFLVAWIGPEVRAAAPVLAILVLAIAAAMPQLVASAMMSMSGFHRRTGLLAAAMAFSNLVLSLILVREWGLIGPAWSTLICVVVYDLVVAPRLVCDAFQLSLPHYYRESLLPLLPVGAGAGLLIWMMRVFFDPPHLLGVAVCGALGSAAFLAGALATGVLPVPARLRRRRARLA